MKSVFIPIREFPKIGGHLNLGVLIIRILLFRVLFLGSPIFGKALRSNKTHTRPTKPYESLIASNLKPYSGTLNPKPCNNVPVGSRLGQATKGASPQLKKSPEMA